MDTQEGGGKGQASSRDSPWERRVLTAKNTGFKRSHGQEHRIQTFSRLKTQLTSHGTMKRGARLERAVRGKNKEAEGTKKKGDEG